jgi:UDPglucose--hexose-1-phosphate uridylyltransferase
VVEAYSGNGKEWQVLVVENKYPALTLNNPKAYGKQEVIIETPIHKKEIHELSVENIVKVIDVYIDRYLALRNMKDIHYVLVFKNEGGKAGASIAHSHSQVMALPMVPPEIGREYEAYAKYEIEKGNCPYCDIIKLEQDKNRVVVEDEHFLVFCPYASQFVYGVWFVPKRHINHMNEMTEAEKESLARSMKKVLAKLDEIDVAYNYFFHNAVNDEDYHMHLKLEPRPNIWAGLELGTGIIINSVPPEEAAKFYRK